MRHARLWSRLGALLLGCLLCCGWVWPLDPQPRVVAGFDAPTGPYAAGHRGADLAAEVGEPVRSAGFGVVAFAGPVAGRGVVSVDHADGRRTTYEPVSPVVAAGDPVREGQVLGTLSAAPGHCLPATCLHWGLRVGETYLDPLALVGAVTVRLLPVWNVDPADGPDPWAAPLVGHWQATAPDRGPLMARG